MYVGVPFAAPPRAEVGGGGCQGVHPAVALAGPTGGGRFDAHRRPTGEPVDLIRFPATSLCREAPLLVTVDRTGPTRND